MACKSELHKIIEKHPNGKAKIEYVYPDKDDTTNFTYNTYYENGQMLYKCRVVDMKFVGEKINYFDNGHIYTIEKLVKPTAFNDSIYDCEIIQNDSSGRPQYHYAYKNGSRNGISKKFDTSGHLIETVDWVTGKQNGKQTRYYARGKVRSIVYYRNDTAINYTYLFNEKGDTLKYAFHNPSGDIALPYKKWLSNGWTLTGNYINAGQTKALWQWFDKIIKKSLLKPKLDLSLLNEQPELINPSFFALAY